MATETSRSWPKLMTLITAMILGACGGSGTDSISSNLDSPNPPASSSGVGTLGTSLGDTPRAAPVVVSYSDGSVVQFNPGTAAYTNFSLLLTGPYVNSPVTFMTAYDDGNNHFMALTLSTNQLALWNGSSWTNLGFFTAGVTVKQMIAFKNSFVIGLSNGAVMQFIGEQSVNLHDASFNSAVSHMVVDTNGRLVVSWDNKKILRMDSCANTNSGCSWTDLHSPASSSTVTNLIAYVGNNNSQPLLAIALSNGAVFIFDDTKWNGIGADGNATITQMIACPSSKSPGKSSFLLAYSDGRVLEWAENFNNSPSSIRVPIISGDPSYGAVTQLVVSQDNLIVGFHGGEVMQATFQTGNVIQKQTLAGPGWGSGVTQMLLINDALMVRLADGRLEEWINSDKTWNDLRISIFSSQTLTQMTVYAGKLELGFSDSSVSQWNGVTNFAYTVLHDNGWKSAVTQLQNPNNFPAVLLENGAVEQWNGIIWQELGPPTQLLPPCVYISDFDESNKSQLITLPDTGSGNRLIEWQSATGSGHSRNNGFPLSFSTSLVIDRTLGFIVNPGQSCAGDSSGSAAINQMVLDTLIGTVYLGYAGNGVVAAWDGVRTDSLIELYGSGEWQSAVSQMAMYNNTLLIFLANGAIEQYDPRYSNNSSHGWHSILSPGKNFDGASITQIYVYNKTLVLGLSNSGVVKWDEGSQSWNYLNNAAWAAPVTQMTTYNGDLVVGLGNSGAVERWKGGTSWIQLQGSSWGAAVNQMIADGPYLLVGLNNGRIEEWNDVSLQWTEAPTPHGSAVTQMMSKNLTSSTSSGFNTAPGLSTGYADTQRNHCADPQGCASDEPR